MAALLLHSMAEFEDLVMGALAIAGATHVVEIGAEDGAMTRRLLEWTRERDGSLVSVDPSPARAVERLFRRHPHARLLRATSLEALPALTADAWLIDGDHNWYTVFHESRLAWESTRASGRPFLAFYHDVGWPWARRDLYYAPDRIPEEHRQPHAWDRGVTLDEAGLVAGGFRGEGQWACAEREGGPRNGVLTAIEDFVAGKERELTWACIPAVFGLGVLFERSAPWAEDLGRFLLPWHMNPLLDRLERNRLECYLEVIAWQDRFRDRAA